MLLLLHALLVGQHEPFTQVLPVQQSVSVVQGPWPLGIQPTHTPLSQNPEQHWVLLVQEPAFAMQQVPLLHVWLLEQQLLPQTLPSRQHDPLTQLWPAGQQTPLQTWLAEQHVVPPRHVSVEAQQRPLQQFCEQQSALPLQMFPAGRHGPHVPFWQICVPVAQQFASV
jgi:hypothetical protein